MRLIDKVNEYIFIFINIFLILDNVNNVIRIKAEY